MRPLGRKVKIKLACVAALTALIAGSMLATGPGGPDPAPGRASTGSPR